jgi:hypothetical protein
MPILTLLPYYYFLRNIIAGRPLNLATMAIVIINPDRYNTSIPKESFIYLL